MELPPELVDGILAYVDPFDTQECYHAHPLFRVLSQGDLLERVLTVYRYDWEIPALYDYLEHETTKVFIDSISTMQPVIQIFIRDHANCAGKTVTYNIRVDETGADLKAKIVRKFKMPPEAYNMIRLIYGGLTIYDKTKLYRIGIKEFSTLDLIMKLMSCNQCGLNGCGGH